MNDELIAAYFAALPHEQNDPAKPQKITLCLSTGETQQVSLVAWNEQWLLVALGTDGSHQVLYSMNSIKYIGK